MGAESWFYQSEGEEVGPVAPVELRRLADSGVVTPDTPVRKGTDGPWIPARKLQGLWPQSASVTGQRSSPAEERQGTPLQPPDKTKRHHARRVGWIACIVVLALITVKRVWRDERQLENDRRAREAVEQLASAERSWNQGSAGHASEGADAASADSSSAESIEKQIRDAAGQAGYVVGERGEEHLKLESRRLAENLPALEGVTEEGEYLDGEKHGQWFARYPSGEVQRQGKYVHGNREGLWEFYFPNGQVSARGEYRANQQTGVWTYWYKNGMRWYEETYKGGRKSGTKTTWYENGAVSQSTEFVDGIMHGRSQIWHPNGNRKKEGQFVMGKQHGEVRYYDEAGELTKVQEYSAGVRVR